MRATHTLPGFAFFLVGMTTCEAKLRPEDGELSATSL